MPLLRPRPPMGPSERQDGDLPERVVEPARVEDERAELLGREGFQARHFGLRFGSVDDDRERPVVDRHVHLIARNVLGDLDDLDPLGRNRPHVLFLAERVAVVRRADLPPSASASGLRASSGRSSSTISVPSSRATYSARRPADRVTGRSRRARVRGPRRRHADRRRRPAGRRFRAHSRTRWPDGIPPAVPRLRVPSGGGRVDGRGQEGPGSSRSPIAFRAIRWTCLSTMGRSRLSSTERNRGRKCRAWKPSRPTVRLVRLAREPAQQHALGGHRPLTLTESVEGGG